MILDLAIKAFTASLKSALPLKLSQKAGLHLSRDQKLLFQSQNLFQIACHMYTPLYRIADVCLEVNPVVNFGIGLCPRTMCDAKIYYGVNPYFSNYL